MVGGGGVLNGVSRYSWLQFLSDLREARACPSWHSWAVVSWIQGSDPKALTVFAVSQGLVTGIKAGILLPWLPWHAGHTEGLYTYFLNITDTGSPPSSLSLG